MNTVTFRGCKIRYIDVRQQEAGVICRLHLTADFSGPVREALGWGDLAAGIDSAKLTGELLALYFVLTPADKQLAKAHEVQMGCQDVGDFTFVRTEAGEDGAGGKEVLRLIMRTSEEGAAGILEAYWRRVGDAPAALKVSYQVQAQLPLTDAPGVATSDFSVADEGEKQEVAAGPALASAVQMAGSTAELKRKRGRPRKVQPITADPQVEVIHDQRSDAIPSDPHTPEWRTADEIAAGVPRYSLRN
jgi:hypothetical protein